MEKQKIPMLIIGSMTTFISVVMMFFCLIFYIDSKNLNYEFPFSAEFIASILLLVISIYIFVITFKKVTMYRIKSLISLLLVIAIQIFYTISFFKLFYSIPEFNAIFVLFFFISYAVTLSVLTFLCIKTKND